MNDYNGTLNYNGTTYRLVFNLNVMERIQEAYGSLDEWGALTDGSKGEPNAKAIIYGFTEMINEGIDIANDENGTDEKPLNYKQVGRIISAIGLTSATMTLNDTVINSTKSAEKNS